jgi:hypothetical protein
VKSLTNNVLTKKEEAVFNCNVLVCSFVLCLNVLFSCVLSLGHQHLKLLPLMGCSVNSFTAEWSEEEAFIHSIQVYIEYQPCVTRLCDKHTVESKIYKVATLVEGYRKQVQLNRERQILHVLSHM